MATRYRPEDASISFGRTGGIHHTAYHSYEHDSYVPPLAVTYMGNTIFPKDQPGCFWQRNGSELFSIELVTAGNIRFTQDRRDYIVNPGEVFLVRRRCHNLMRTGPAGFAHKRFMVVEGDMVDTVLEMTGVAYRDHIVLARPHFVATLMKEGLALLSRADRGFARRLSAIAYELIVELGRDCHQADTPEALLRALRFLRRNMNRKVSSAETADHVGISVASLNRLFRRHLGVSPIRYLAEQRMAYARQLLVSTSEPVKAIALELGFSDPLYFSAQFSKQVGVSPRAYRRAHAGPSRGEAVESAAR
jgi:AraC-like DNA-binding protein